MKTEFLVHEIFNLEEIVGKLFQINSMSIKAKFNIIEIVEAITNKTQNIHKVRTEIVNEYCEQDNGTIKTNEDGSPMLKKEASKEEFQAKIEEFLQTKVSIEHEPLVDEILHFEDNSLSFSDVLLLRRLMDKKNKGAN